MEEPILGVFFRKGLKFATEHFVQLKIIMKCNYAILKCISLSSCNRYLWIYVMIRYSRSVCLRVSSMKRRICWRYTGDSVFLTVNECMILSLSFLMPVCCRHVPLVRGSWVVSLPEPVRLRAGQQSGWQAALWQCDGKKRVTGESIRKDLFVV